jgi:serine/threonine-protein kinase
MEPAIHVEPTLSWVAVQVPCVRCGDQLSYQVAAPAPAELTAFCPDCRTQTLDRPTLPAPYRFVREIGRGGMGAVYLCWHPDLELERAVKMVLPQGALSADCRARFLAEARVQARLSHPRIVQVHEFSEVEPAVFAIVMEYVPGPDAGRLLRERGTPGLPPAEAATLAAQALEALAHVHASGVVHCDIKDPNLLVAGSGAKLTDFGLARSFAASGPGHTPGQEIISGTLPYMAPEQARSQGLVDPRSDLYSLGATLYRLLTGAYPHDFPEGCDRLRVVREGAPAPVRVRNASVPEPLAAVVDRALARHPEARFASAGEMREALLATA